MALSGMTALPFSPILAPADLYVSMTKSKRTGRKVIMAPAFYIQNVHAYLL